MNEVRIGDRERDQALEFLREHCADGVLSLDEFSDRAGQALAATTSTELAVVVADLPARPYSPAQEPPAPPRRRRKVKIRLSVFGGSRQAGHWRPAEHNVAVALFGSLSLDLREAALDSRGLNIHAFACFGSVSITGPEDVEIDCSAIGIFGGAKGSSAPVDDRMDPIVIHVDGLAVFGSISAKTKARRARRAARRSLDRTH